MKKKKVKERIKKENAKNSREKENDEEDIGEVEAAEVEQEHNSEKEKASSALLPGKRGKLKRKAKVKEETLDLPESPDTDDSKLSKGMQWSATDNIFFIFQNHSKMHKVTWTKAILIQILHLRLLAFIVYVASWQQNIPYFFAVTSAGKGEKKKKKKTVKVKRKNRINTEVPSAYTQPVDLSTTFGKYWCCSRAPVNCAFML